MKKRPLRTSKDIYNRLKWDHSFPAESVWIGYEDRMEGHKEIPFADFRPGGRIPWDRLQYFRMGEVRIWDRQARLDRVFGSGDTDESERLDAQLNLAGFGSGFISRDAWRWDALENRWEQARPATAKLPDRIHLLTFNVMRTDMYGENVPHATRIPALLDFLQSTDADLIALQEVQGEFFQALLAHPYFRDGWFLSDGPEPKTLGRLGVLILSRIRPAQVLEFRFPDLRPAMLMRFEFPGQNLLVATVHLPSNFRENAHQLRQHCLDELNTALPKKDTTLFIGDFNIHDGDPEIFPEGFRDLFDELNPGLQTPTFDPVKNPIAALNSRTGLSVRLDRIFLRDPQDRLFPRNIELSATEPYASNRYLSDHFALKAEIDFQLGAEPLLSSATTHRSALCLIPPPEAQAEIQALRRLHDDRFDRWMPHINLLYGFLPESTFPVAAAVIAQRLANLPSFELSLESVEAFHHGRSATLWLKADENGIEAMQTLQAELLQLFPQCTEQNRNGIFSPHLSLGKFRGKELEQLEERLEEWNAAWPGLRFTVDRICLISRREDDPFAIREEVFLGEKGAENDPIGLETALGMAGWLPGAVARARQERAWEAIRKAHEGVSGALSLEKTGSAGLGTGLTGGDLDLLATGSLRRESYFGHLERLLKGKWPKIALRRIEDALVPLLKIELFGQQIDLLYAGMEPDDHGNRLSRSASTELKCLQSAVGERLPAFRLVVRALKAFAKVRQLDDHAFGWPGGLAWTVMAAAFPSSASPEKWLKNALEQLANRDWREVLRLGVTTADAPEAPLRILSCAAPEVNITRNVTEGNLALLRTHLLEAWEIASDAEAGLVPWSKLFLPKTEHFPAHLELRLRAGKGADMESSIGWLRRHILSLVLHWEAQLTIGLRAFSQFERSDAHTASLHFGIADWPNAEQQQVIHELLSEMEEKFAGWDGRPATAGLVGHLRMEEWSIS